MMRHQPGPARTASRTLSPVLLALALTAAPASATVVFQVETNQWTVLSLTCSCLAINRPLNEFNAAPFNALQFRATPQGETFLDVQYWPIYFVAGEAYTVKLSIDRGRPIEVPAASPPGVDFSVSSTAPLGDDVLAALGNGETLTVTVAGTPQALTFEIGELRSVLPTLHVCAGLLEPAN